MLVTNDFLHPENIQAEFFISHPEAHDLAEFFCTGLLVGACRSHEFVLRLLIHFPVLLATICLVDTKYWHLGSPKTQVGRRHLVHRLLWNPALGTCDYRRR